MTVFYSSFSYSTLTSFNGPSSNCIRSSRLGVPITSKILISWCVSARNSSPKRSFWSFSLRFEDKGKHELPGNSGWTRRFGSKVCKSSAYIHTSYLFLQEYNPPTRCQSQHCNTVGGESAQEHDTNELQHVALADAQPRSYHPILQLGQHHSTHHFNHTTTTFVSLTSWYW